MHRQAFGVPGLINFSAEKYRSWIELCASLNEGGLTPLDGLMHSDPALILISCSPLSGTIFRVTISAAAWRADRYLIPFSEPNSIKLTGRGFVAVFAGCDEIL